MFGYKKLKNELEKKMNYNLDCLVDKVDCNKRSIELLESKVKSIEMDIDKKMTVFYKEITKEIAERYFLTLERIFRTNKEISLISALAHSVNDKDMANLKSELLKPFLENRWAEDKRKKGEQVVNKGVQVIEARRKLHEEILRKERQGEKAENIDKLKIRLDTYDEVLKEIR